MSSVERDPERGRAAAARLKALGVKGILIKAAEQGERAAAETWTTPSWRTASAIASTTP
jgi:hypothetical protein